MFIDACNDSLEKLTVTAPACNPLQTSDPLSMTSVESADSDCRTVGLESTIH